MRFFLLLFSFEKRFSKSTDTVCFPVSILRGRRATTTACVRLSRDLRTSRTGEKNVFRQYDAVRGARVGLFEPTFRWTVRRSAVFIPCERIPKWRTQQKKKKKTDLVFCSYKPLTLLLIHSDCLFFFFRSPLPSLLLAAILWSPGRTTTIETNAPPCTMYASRYNAQFSYS